MAASPASAYEDVYEDSLADSSEHAAGMTTAEEIAAAVEAALRASGLERGQARQEIVDTRVLNKPKLFAGDSEEWGTWRFNALNFLGCIHAKYPEEIEAAEGHGTMIDDTGLDEAASARSRTLFAILCSLLGERPLRFVMHTPV